MKTKIKNICIVIFTIVLVIISLLILYRISKYIVIPQ